MIQLNFKQFFTEEDIRNWLLGRPERDRGPLVPPVSATPEELLSQLERAEQKGDFRATQKAKAEIEAHGYNVKITRNLSPKRQLRKAAKWIHNPGS